MWETWVRSLGWEDPLGKGKATHSSILAWRIPWRPQFNCWIGKIPWRRVRLPSPVFLDFPDGSAGKESICNAGDLGSIPGLGRSPGEGNRDPLQYSGLEKSMDSPWGRKESDRTERLSLSLLHQTVNKGSTVKLLDIKNC